MIIPNILKAIVLFSLVIASRMIGFFIIVGTLTVALMVPAGIGYWIAGDPGTVIGIFFGMALSFAVTPIAMEFAMPFLGDI